jgi:hypothetical protein
MTLIHFSDTELEGVIDLLTDHPRRDSAAAKLAIGLQIELDRRAFWRLPILERLAAQAQTATTNKGQPTTDKGQSTHESKAA